MNESKPVPRIGLVGALPASLYQDWGCHCCLFRASARSEAALHAAMDAHAAYVNTQLDRETDPHFYHRRLEALIRG